MFITEDLFKSICNICDKILLSNGIKYEHVSVQWLHVIRAHPQFLKNYEWLFTCEKKYENIKKIIIYDLKYGYGIFKLFLNALSFTKKNWTENITIGENYDFVFVSHLLNNKNICDKDDLYFGSIPEELSSLGYSVLVVLINHDKSIENNFLKNNNKNNLTKIVIPNLLTINEEIAIIKKTNIQSNKFSKMIDKVDAILEKKILKIASLEVKQEATKKGIRVAIFIKKLLEKNNVRLIITTYEGHAWERLVYAASRSINKNIKCVGYQHAGMFQFQHAAKRSLGKSYDPDVILASGKIGLSQLKSLEGLKAVSFDVLGSPRLLKNVERTINSTCLVMPEGILSECEILFEFSLKCAYLFPEVKFIWRLHPGIKNKSLSKLKMKLQNIPSNIIISNENFEKDLAVCNWALYRGTTAIVAAAANNIIPIYVRRPSELTIDPLHEISKFRPSIEFPQDILRILKNSKVSREVVEYCKLFYTPINLKILTAIL
jgi:hypothetical protein